VHPGGTGTLAAIIRHPFAYRHGSNRVSFNPILPADKYVAPQCPAAKLKIMVALALNEVKIRMITCARFVTLCLIN